ncbi:bifunctional chorismate mutase/prephenate dehydrogenase [Idiomarina aquatica]|jgi:chorismate mutase/prephenate dehydrogenase|uniref:chorismate mutase n=1 Tax=Idiomarina aquatica TaxID=1327752 RepID=A0AA94JDR5_9GAMM|nr:bifunctional chorismate mutase/prephenate dehydrogenase [Idiomarina aquatica]RUO43131.1 bifunctional chorismate mutase/prephenate dehydrogenase [Idiomarina aquatica]
MSSKSADAAATQLSQLRDAIDAVDTQLVDLIAQRAAITAQVGQVKRQLKQPLYVPEREHSLIRARRQYAEQKGLAADLIEDVLRRIIRESYRTQTMQATPTSTDLSRPVVIVGGRGRLGQLLAKLFGQTGYQVTVLDKGDQWTDELAAQAQLVMLSVPVNQTVGVIRQLPALAADCVLADVTSVKSEPLQAMLEQHSGPVVGLHPMFGPSVQNLAKQLVVVTPGRCADACQWLLDQFVNWGAHIETSDAGQHDEAMGWVQAMRHLSTFSYGLHMAEENADIDALLQMSSPIYRMELMMVGRLFAQNAELYADIIMANKQQFPTIGRYLERFGEALGYLEKGDKARFIEQFEQVKAYFGNYASQFLDESEGMVQLADDQRFRQQHGG